MSSEIISEGGIHSELANDFVLDQSAYITIVRWWGAYYQYVSGDPIGFPTSLKSYEDDGGVPAGFTPFLETICLDGHESFLYEQHPTVQIYEYWVDFDGPEFLGGVTYWFVAQCCDHPFPPQWGRLGSDTFLGHISAFRSGHWGYPYWTPTDQIFDGGLDAAQEFECSGEPTAAPTTTWGTIKALY